MIPYFSKYAGIEEKIDLIFKAHFLFGPFVEKLNFDTMPNLINFRTNIKTKSILSIAPCKKSCIIKLYDIIC